MYEIMSVSVVWFDILDKFRQQNIKEKTNQQTKDADKSEYRN